MKKNQVIKAGIGYTVGNYCIKGLTFLTIPIFARLLSTSDYGIYNTFVAYEAILYLFIGFALNTSYKNAKLKYGLISEGNSKYNFETYASVTVIFMMAVAIVWLIVANLFFPLLGNDLSLDRISINLLVVYAFGSAVIACFNARASLTYQYKNFLKVAFLNVVGNIGISVILIETIFNKERYMGRIIGTVLPIFILAVVIIGKWIKVTRPRYAKEFLKWGLKFSLPIVPHGISQVILSQFDRIMITNMVGSAQSGVYSFAYNIYSILSVTYTSIDTVWGQWFYDKLGSKNFEAIKKYSSIYMVSMLLFSMSVMLASPELILILGSVKYRDAIYCVIPIIAGGYFAYLYTIPCEIEYYNAKTGFIALGTVSAAVINIVLNYLCILRWGYVAAAYTTLVTYIIYFLFHYLLAWQINGSCAFSNKTVLFCSVSIIAVSFAELQILQNPFLRWIMVLIFMISAVFIEEKSFKVITHFIMRKDE